MRARFSAGMPIPVSEIRTMTSPSSDPAVTSTRPPEGVYFTAFSTRFENIEVSWVSSPRTVYRSVLPERFQERVMFFWRAAGRRRESTSIKTPLTSTGVGFGIPSSLSRRARSKRSVINCASLSVSFFSCSAKKRACSGSSSRISTRLSARSLRLVAGVFSSWETFATKSRRILLTRLSSTRLTEPAAPEPASPLRSSIPLLTRPCPLHLRRYPFALSRGFRPGPESVAQAAHRVHVLVVALLRQGRPHAPYVHVYRARRAHPRVPPHLLGQLLPALELPGARRQGRQQLELLEPQPQRLPPHQGGEVLRVQAEVLDLDDLAP